MYIYIKENPNKSSISEHIYNQKKKKKDMAIDYAQCEFYGFDIAEPAKLSEIEKLHQPKNCHIKQADVFDGFDYDANTFDFVHQRIMYSVYPTDRVSWMFQEILRITKPNGWVEFVEPDLTPKRAGPLFSKVMKACKYSKKTQLLNIHYK